MGQVKLFRLILAFAITFTAAKCQKMEPSENKIIFTGKQSLAIDAIKRVDQLMQKFPDSFMVNYFVDNDGYLYLNNQKIGLLNGVASNQKVTSDLVFEKFDRREVEEFLDSIILLMSSGIEGAHKERSIGKILFSYNNKQVRSWHKSRDLMVVSQRQDTSGAAFTRYFKIIDREENIVLLGLKE